MRSSDNARDDAAQAPAGSSTAAARSPLGRLLALDVGTKRIGVAVSDPLGLSARPLVTLAVTSPSHRREAAAIAALARQWEAAAIIVGLPLLPSGDEGEGAPMIRALADELRAVISIPVIFGDESYSTQEAEARRPTAKRGRAGGHAKGRDDRGASRRQSASGPGLDAEAAAVILEEWLLAHGSRAREVLAAASGMGPE